MLEIRGMGLRSGTLVGLKEQPSSLKLGTYSVRAILMGNVRTWCDLLNLEQKLKKCPHMDRFPFITHSIEQIDLLLEHEDC